MRQIALSRPVNALNVIDFLPANWLNSTHPETPFTQHRIVMRQTPEGRQTLFDERLKTVTGGQTHTREIVPGELAAVPREHFGLELEADAVTLIRPFPATA